MRTVEGKDPIPIKSYKYLARVLLTIDDLEWREAHLFLLLDWNLMSRAKNVMRSNIDLVTVTDKALGRTRVVRGMHTPILLTLKYAPTLPFANI